MGRIMKTNKRLRKILPILTIILMILSIQLSLAEDSQKPAIEFVEPTPQDEATQMIGIVDININITEENLSSFTYKWNGINTTLYDSSLLLMYNFNNIESLGESSSLVYDISGNENNGSVQNQAAPTNPGKYNGAYSFDGYDDYITIGEIQFGQSFTVSSWIKPSAWGTSTDAYIHNIFSNENGAGSTFAFRLGSKGQYGYRDNLAIAIYQDGSANDYESTQDLSLNTWQHIAATWDGNTIKFYVNGKPSNQQSASHTMDSGTKTFMVAHSPDYNRPYAGEIDELYAYNRVLNDTEIYQHYASNLHQINQTHWQFNVTQAKNTDEELDIGTYSYQSYATDLNSNTNSTEERTIYIVGITPPVPEASTLLLTAMGGIILVYVASSKRRQKNE